MTRKLIIKDTASNTEYVMPVTPMPAVESGVSMEVINISKLGDVARAGNATLSAPKLELLLPAQAYPFCVVAPLAPYKYIELFNAWAKTGTVIRLIWTDTGINIPVLVETVRAEERDGSRDVYATISTREYRPITAELQPLVSTSAVSVGPVRDEAAASGEQRHIIVSGDTLWGICRTAYGDGSVYPQVAAYNNLKNPNLIPIGTVIKLPDKSVLSGLKGVVVTSTTEYPAPPEGVQKRYSDSLLAAKEQQMEKA